MANHYVRSGAGGANDGTSWTDAFTDLSTAFVAGSAGDTFWVADDHSEDNAGNTVIISGGTASSPCRAVCVNTHIVEPPTGLGTGAVVRVSGAVASMYIEGFCYWQGVEFTVEGGHLWINTNTGGASGFSNFENCQFTLESAAARQIFTNNAFSTSFGQDTGLTMKNTSIKFGATTQAIHVGVGVFLWKDSTCLAAGSLVPNNLFLSRRQSGHAFIRNCDISGVNTTLVGKSQRGSARYTFENCKIHASVTPITTSLDSPGGPEIVLVNCDSGDTNYRYHKQNYMGTIEEEISVVRSGGASDAVTNMSRKLTTTSGSGLFQSLVSDPVGIWNDTIDDTVTITISIINDGVTMTDEEVWVDVEYLGTDGFPLGVSASDRVEDIFATPVAQPLDSDSSWNGSLGSPIKQLLSVDVIPKHKGPILARVCLARPSATMYFDPKIQIS